MKVKLIKPWSVWTLPLHKDCIAIFQYIDGMWREGGSAIVGIGRDKMDWLLSNGYAIKQTI